MPRPLRATLGMLVEVRRGDRGPPRPPLWPEPLLVEVRLAGEALKTAAPQVTEGNEGPKELQNMQLLLHLVPLVPINAFINAFNAAFAAALASSC